MTSHGADRDFAGRRSGRVAARATSWWGMTLGVAALASMLSTIIFAALFLRGVSGAWPQAPARSLVMPGLVLALTLASAVTVGWAHRSVRTRSRARLQTGSAVGSVLGVGILAAAASDLATVGFRWDAHAYGSVYWLGVGFQGMATLAGVVMMLAAAVQVWRDDLGSRGRAAAANTALFWYFVVGGWWCIYVTLLAVVR